MGFREKNERGIGLVEAVFASALLLMISVTTLRTLPEMRIRASHVTSTSYCEQAAIYITTAIKAHDNSLQVRNWFQSNSTPLTRAVDVQDAFCKNSEGRTEVCEQFLTFELEPSTPYVDQTKYLNYLNVRGAFVWAQSVYNANRGGGLICTGDGIDLTPSELGKLLPSQINLQNDVIGYQLFVRDTSKPCGTLSNSRTASFDVRVTVRLKSSDGRISSCHSEINLLHNRDNEAPIVTLNATNGDGVTIPAGRCSETRDLSLGPSPGWQTMNLIIGVNEPGTLLLCRRQGSFEADPSEKWRNCPDLTLSDGASFDLSPNHESLSFNTLPNPIMTMSALPDRGNPFSGQEYRYEVKAIDVSGNESVTTTANFFVHRPVCADPNTYCPNATPANPGEPHPWSGPFGPDIHPWDDCENGRCPTVGTHSVCADSSNICVGITYNDDCGLPKCNGTKPPSCDAITTDILSEIPCGASVAGECGAMCGPGTLPDCVGAPSPDEVTCCESIVGRCGANCGIGSMDCPTDNPATPLVDESISCGADPVIRPPTSLPDWSWGPGMFQVDQSSGTMITRTYVHPAGSIPAGYSRYELDIWVEGTSDRRASRITVTAILSGATTETFTQSGGPFLPIDTRVPFFRGTIGVDGLGPPSLTIIVSLKETFSQVFFNIRGVP